MTTRKNIRQQNAERRLSHLRWEHQGPPVDWDAISTIVVVFVFTFFVWGLVS